MQLSDVEIVALLEPLTHKRIGSIDYTVENYEKYWYIFSKFGLVSDPDFTESSRNLKNFYSIALHGVSRQWNLPRGRIQSISYKANRIDQHSTRLMRRFRENVPEVQYVYEVKDGTTWGDTLGYVVSSGAQEDASRMAAMMYHTTKEVAVERTKPMFNIGSFLTRQSFAQNKIQKKIKRHVKSIAQLQREITEFETRLCDIVTNSVCFSGEE